MESRSFAFLPEFAGADPRAAGFRGLQSGRGEDSFLARIAGTRKVIYRPNVREYAALSPRGTLASREEGSLQPDLEINPLDSPG